ncbi:hypothetical protein AAZX31_15G023400 [Glycine max]
MTRLVKQQTLLVQKHQILPLVYSFDMLGIGTRLLTSTGMHLIHGQLLVFLMIVKVVVEGAPYRYGG